MKLLLIGDGEQAHLAYEYFTHDSDYEVAGFAVERAFRTRDAFLGLPVVDFETAEARFPPSEYAGHVAVSATQLNRVRRRLFLAAKDKGYRLANYVSSRAFVWHNVTLGENVFIFEHNTVQPFCAVGDNTILWSGNHVGHRTRIGSHCFISSHVVLSGFCTVGDGTFIGVNASVADKVAVAEDNFIAMGASVGRNTEPNKVYTGAPAAAGNVPATRFCRVKE
jgi:sugar O-acyltransferase (sialic acid O-acetyltransferase NeuD family)